MIHAKDFGFDPNILAKLLLELDKDEVAYKELLTFKTKGYSDDYKALVDLGDLHSSCRGCILAGDDIRHRDGFNAYDLKKLIQYFDPSVDIFSLFIRERNQYSFTRIGFSEKPKLKTLIEAVLKYLRPNPKNLWIDNTDLRNKPTRRMQIT